MPIEYEYRRGANEENSVASVLCETCIDPETKNPGFLLAAAFKGLNNESATQLANEHLEQFPGHIIEIVLFPTKFTTNIANLLWNLRAGPGPHDGRDS